MSIPTHEPNCKTRLIPTQCRDCGEDVFYFSCNCGSKVFFNSREYPWPKHGDTCLPYLVRLNIEEGFRSLNEIREVVEERARELGVPVPDRVNRILNQDNARRNNSLNLTIIQPTNEIPPVLASVVSITPTINLFKLFRFDDNVISRSLLGDIANHKYSLIRIREEADDNNLSREFIVYLRHSFVLEQALRQNSTVFVKLKTLSIPGRDAIWIADSIERA